MLNSAPSPLPGLAAQDLSELSNAQNTPAGGKNAAGDDAFDRVLRDQSASRHEPQSRPEPPTRDADDSGNTPPPGRRDVAADDESASAAEVADAAPQAAAPQTAAGQAWGDRSAAARGDGSRLPAAGRVAASFDRVFASAEDASRAVARRVLSRGDALTPAAGAVLNAAALEVDSSGRAGASAAEGEAPPDLEPRALAAARASAQGLARSGGASSAPGDLARSALLERARSGAASSASDDGSPAALVASLHDEAGAARLATRAVSTAAAKLTAPAHEGQPPLASREAAAPAAPPASPPISGQGGLHNANGSASNFTSAPGVDLAMQRAPTDPEFADELGARIQVMLRDGLGKAQIQLHPVELGRLQVTISTDGDQARVAFLADAGATRDAIEQSLPRLREMLEQNGLQLAQSDVGQRGFQRQDSQPDGSADARDPELPGAAEADAQRQGDTGAADARIDTYI